MNILFVVDEYPFPPRNGVTIPTANWIRLFVNSGCRVDLLVLDGIVPASPNATRPDFDVGVIEHIRLRPNNRLIGYFLELLGISPVFERWSTAGAGSRGQLLESYDLIWASPIRAFSIWLKLSARLGIRARSSLAAVNDSYALTLAALAQRKQRPWERWLYLARSRAMRKIERRILGRADFIGVQSLVEVDFFNSIFRTFCTPEILVLKNGVDDLFFGDRLTLKLDLLFVGTLDDNYRPTIHWFIKEVYASFPEPRPRFGVIGSMANEGDLNLFNEFGIEYNGFVNDIAACYCSSTILVAPIFKGFGTINKVLEAMASGCVVIGDSSAFNGIENFEPGRHGLIASTAQEFITCISAVIADRSLTDSIGSSARNLIREEFSWESRMESIVERLFK